MPESILCYKYVETGSFLPREMGTKYHHFCLLVGLIEYTSINDIFDLISTATPCLSAPCYNGGTCRNVDASFECQCLPGYRGDRCEIEGNRNLNYFILLANHNY